MPNYMGNVRWSAEAIDFINPHNNPYQHIISISGVHQYITSASGGLDVHLGTIIYAKSWPLGGAVKTFKPCGDMWHIPILPPVDPFPQPIKTGPRVEAVIDELFETTDFLQQLSMQKVGAVRVSSGRLWARLPVTALSSRLSEMKYKPQSTYSQLGRGHRIQDFIINLERYEQP